MLTVENVLKNYEELMAKNGYSEIEKLRNLQTIRNVINYGSEVFVNSLTYDCAITRYPKLTTWCDIPRSFLDMLMDSYIIPQNIIVTNDGTKYLIGRLVGSDILYPKLDITNDVYSHSANTDEENAVENSAYDNTVTRWNMFITKVSDALNMKIYKYLKDTYPEILREHVSEDFYKSIDVKYAEAQKIFLE